MVSIPQTNPDPNTAHVKVVIEEAQYTQPRTYMGMSGMGDPCERRIWLRFRHAVTEHHGAQSLLAFEDGHLTEALMIKRLKDAGFKVEDRIDGKQIAFSDFGGHFRGNMDGIITGLLDAPKKTHVLEIKATNEKSFGALVKHIDTLGPKAALFAWKPEYYVQAQLYMHYFGTDRHYTVVATPGGRDFTGLRTEYDAAAALRYRALAERLIFTDEAPMAFPESHFMCRMCYIADACRGRKEINRTCRTCLHVTPMRDGTWHCAKHNAEAKAVCGEHRYLPSLIPGKVVQANEQGIVYHLHKGGVWVDEGK